MFYNNAPPLPGGGAVAGLRETPGAGTFWSTARNGLRTYSSAPSTEQMMAGAEISGVRSAVQQVGRSNGTISKAFNTANNAMSARNLYQSGSKFLESRGAGSSTSEALGDAFPKTLGRVLGGDAAGGTEAAVAGGEAAAAAPVAAAGTAVAGEAVAAGGEMAVAGGLEAAGVAADSTGVGLVVGIPLAIIGGALALHAMKGKKGGPGAMPPTGNASISMSLRAPNAFGMKPPTQSFG